MAGLRRLAGEPARGAVGSGQPGGLDRAGRRLAGLGVVAGRLPRRAVAGLTDWAAGRALAPTSLTGIALLAALCASAWFSGGTASDDASGVVAVCGWLLVTVGAGRLAAPAGRPGTGAGPARPGAREGGGGARAARRVPGPAVAGVAPRSGGTDWLVLPGATWAEGELAEGELAEGELAEGELAETAGAGTARAGTARAEAARAEAARAGTARAEAVPGFGWLAAVSAAAGECAIYGGIAAGGQAAGWSGMWPLAVIVLISALVADAFVACSGASAAGGLARAVGGDSAIWRGIGLVLAPPAAVRVALAAAGLAARGPRVALFVVLATEIASACYALARLGRLAPPGQAGRARPGVVRACRDDGAVVRWAGRLVQGNLMPLPPAIAGVAATVLLASLGLRQAAGLLALAPLVVMMLAAPGSGHAHDGRFDWLTPVFLLLGQIVYLAALGFAWDVPGAVTYSLCAMTACWYAAVAAGLPGAAGTRRRRQRPRVRRSGDARSGRSATGIGWEARMLVAGLAAVFGIATFGYLGLAAYLGVLICREVLTGYFRPREGIR